MQDFIPSTVGVSYTRMLPEVYARSRHDALNDKVLCSISDMVSFCNAAVAHTLKLSKVVLIIPHADA